MTTRATATTRSSDALALDFEVPGARTTLLSSCRLGGTWLPKMLTYHCERCHRAPDDHYVDTYATGVSVSQQFLIGVVATQSRAKGVLKIEVDLTPYGAATETGLA